MSTSDLNKEYLKYTKQEAKKWHFYLGGDPILRPDENPNAFDWGTDVNFLYRVRENDVSFVTDRIDWTIRLAAKPWTPNSNTDDRTLIFNPINSTAYLCVSDNLNNRSDPSIRGKQQSLYSPSHANGLLSYEDGYSWYALFVVDPTKLDIITTSKIPVMSIDDFTTDPNTTSLTQKYSQICGAGFTAMGTCCLYTKEETKDALGVTSIEGDLTYVKVATNCYRCTELAQKLNCEYVFKTGITVFPAYPACTPCDCSIEIVDKITEIQRNLGNLNPSGFFRHVYSNYLGWEDPSEILSVFINLATVSDKDRIIPLENPKVKFDTITGEGAEAELITEYLGGNNYRVDGIRLLSRGKNYKNGDAIPVISGLENSILNNLIEVNVAPEDFPENPVSMLNKLETCIKVSISNTMIEQSNTNIRDFTRYGIIRDVRLDSDNTLASEGLNANEYQVLRATTVLTLGVTLPEGPVIDVA
jgi:hypothetical protein